MLIKDVNDWSCEFGGNSSEWSFMHELKTKLPIFMTLGGIVKFLKEFSQICLRWGGNVKLSTDDRENTYSPIVWSSESGGNSTFCRYMQL